MVFVVLGIISAEPTSCFCVLPLRWRWRISGITLRAKTLRLSAPPFSTPDSKNANFCFVLAPPKEGCAPIRYKELRKPILRRFFGALETCFIVSSLRRKRLASPHQFVFLTWMSILWKLFTKLFSVLPTQVPRLLSKRGIKSHLNWSALVAFRSTAFSLNDIFTLRFRKLSALLLLRL